MTRRMPASVPGTVTGRRVWLAERANGARWHAGIDCIGRPGSTVVAPEDGVVRLVLPDADAVQGWGGYGPGVVLLAGASGAFHALAHVRPTCAEGDIVTAGAKVAEQTDYRHVHWEVRAVPIPTAGRAVVEDCADPLAWIEGRIERWDGRCPPRPGDSYRTPRACRPSWRGPRPAPLVPWPSPRAAPPGDSPGERPAASPGTRAPSSRT